MRKLRDICGARIRGISGCQGQPRPPKLARRLVFKGFWVQGQGRMAQKSSKIARKSMTLHALRVPAVVFGFGRWKEDGCVAKMFLQFYFP